jgi:ABC-2 type transport system ATP-binding protein
MLTIRENLEFAGHYFSMNAITIKERIDYLGQRLHIADYFNHRPNQLSGGYRQRCMIARACIHSPRFLILDEPTAALDPDIRRKLWELILSFKDEGISILLTTHYLDEAEILSDRVCVLDQGLVKLIDTPKNLMSTFQKNKLEDVFLHLTQSDAG